MAQFVMPSLGADMEAGTVVEWLVKPGDHVAAGDVVAVVDTTKSAVDVECFDSGTVTELLVPQGTSVPVGTPLAVIDGSAVSQREQPVASAEAAESTPDRPAVPVPAPPAVDHKRALPSATPLIRRLAAQEGIDLATVHGSGPGGRVVRQDIEHLRHPVTNGPRRVSPYAKSLAAELGVDPESVPGKGPVTAAQVRALASAPRERLERSAPTRSTVDNRQAVADLMARANREVPHYHLAATIDLHRALTWLRKHNKAVPVTDRLLPAALLLKASALAAARVPDLNGHWVDGQLHRSSTVDLGVAVAVRGGGLLVPIVSQADQLPLVELMRTVREQAARARAGRPRGSDLGAASITVTNLGDLGVDLVHGVIHPPQVALVGFGAVLERPWAVDGLLGVRPLVTATLAADHRATDGAVGARLLTILTDLLQRPEEL